MSQLWEGGHATGIQWVRVTAKYLTVHTRQPPPHKSYLVQNVYGTGLKNPVLQLSAIEKSLDMAFKTTGARAHGRCSGSNKVGKNWKGFGASVALPPSWRIKGQPRRSLGGGIKSSWVK